MSTIFWIIVLPILFTAVYAGFSAAPWLPTKPKQRRHLVDREELRDGKIYYDLGCGDGSVLFALARKNPNIKAIGYEISILPYVIGFIRKLISGKKYKNVSLRFANLFTQDLSDADTVFVFLLAKSYPKLIKKFSKELKDDCRIVVEAWPIPNIQHEERVKEEGLLPIYVYKGSSFR